MKCSQCGREFQGSTSPGRCAHCRLGKPGQDDQRANGDLNLLFGVFAVQLHKVNAGQLMDVAAAWAIDPSRGIPQRLTEAGVLSAKDRDLLLGFVEEAVAANGDDPGATLQAFGGEDMVQQSFCGSLVRNAEGAVTASAPPLIAPDSKDVPGVPESPGRYLERGEYSRGGMGRILLVHDEHLGRDIALKELLPTLGAAVDTGEPTPVRQSAAMLSRFLQEARITGQLEHPSIVPVYELGKRADGAVYYTMKLVRGRTLSSALADTKDLTGRLTLLSHFVDLCHAIAYAHSRGVIHRDLKPGNIMVGEFGETVVIDWGLAKVLGQPDAQADANAATLRAMSLGDAPEDARTAYGAALGTPMYMPPEQAKGQLDQVDERSDVYSLGAVLYQILTGKGPFTGNTSAEVLTKVIHEEPASIRSLAPQAPPELIAICMRAMQKAPTRRYASAKDLAEDIERFLAGSLVGAYQYSWFVRAKRFIRRNKVALRVTFVAAIFLLIASGLYLYNMNKANVEINAANVKINAVNLALTGANAETNAANQALTGANVQLDEKIKELSLSNVETSRQLYRANIMLASSELDRGQYENARTALDKCPPAFANWEWGRLWMQAEMDCKEGFILKQHAMQGHMEPVFSASFSPDGNKIVTASGDKTARVWDALTGVEVHTLTGHNNWVWSASFSPDGRRIVTASRDNTTRVWDATTGVEQLCLKGHSSSARSTASFSPDGSRIVTASGDNTARVWDAVTGMEVHALEGHMETVTSAAFSLDGGRIVTASRDNTARVWDAATEVEQLCLTGHTEEVESASFSPDGSRIVTASGDKTARVWDAATGVEQLCLKGHTGDVYSASFSPDGSRVVTASSDMTARVWDTVTGKELHTLKGHTGFVFSASFNPDGNKIITASWDKTERVWDAKTGKQIRILSWWSGLGLGEPADIGDFVKRWDGGRSFEINESNNTVLVKDLTTDETLMYLSEHQSKPVSLGVSIDGCTLAVLLGDRTVHIYRTLPWREKELMANSLTRKEGVQRAIDEEMTRRQAEFEKQEAVEVAEGRPAPQVGEERTFAEISFVWCPPGTFEPGRRDDKTQHQVTLSQGFWMGKYEVTQAQWESVMGGNTSSFRGADLPVENVSWDDCQVFVRKLSGKGESIFRLPTEAEWEYACRAGSTTAYCFGDDEADLDEYAWYARNSENKAHSVGGKKANAWGLYDMHGNVAEWCHDWYGDYPSCAVTDPAGPPSGEYRVLRGGSWRNSPSFCYSAYRNYSSPDNRLSLYGFRLLRTQKD